MEHINQSYFFSLVSPIIHLFVSKIQDSNFMGSNQQKKESENHETKINPKIFKPNFMSFLLFSPNIKLVAQKLTAYTLMGNILNDKFSSDNFLDRI